MSLVYLVRKTVDIGKQKKKQKSDSNLYYIQTFDIKAETVFLK